MSNDESTTSSLSLNLQYHTVQGAFVQTVDARELHTSLGIATDFRHWIHRRIEEYGFVRERDYVVAVRNDRMPSGGRIIKDYRLTLDMAKELCMVERSPVGRAARQYFIACEKALVQSGGIMTQRFEDLERRLRRLEASGAETNNTLLVQGQRTPPEVAKVVLPGIKRTMPPQVDTKRTAVSMYMAQAWHVLRTVDGWLSNRDLAYHAGIKERSARSYTYYFFGIGVLACQEMFPRHLYRLKRDIEERYPEIVGHLDRCYSILMERAQF